MYIYYTQWCLSLPGNLVVYGAQLGTIPPMGLHVHAEIKEKIWKHEFCQPSFSSQSS